MSRTPSPCSADMFARSCMIGAQSRGQHEADFPLFQNIAGAVAHAGLRPAIAGQPHPERRAVIMRRLPRVADIKLDEIHALQRQKISAATGCWLFRLAVGISPPSTEVCSERVNQHADCLHRSRSKSARTAAVRTRPAAARSRLAAAVIRSTHLARTPRFERNHHEVRLGWNHFQVPSRSANRLIVRSPRAFNSSVRCTNSSIVQRGNPGDLRERARLKRQLHFEQIGDQFFMRESVADRAAPPARRFSKTSAA